ncbi:MAG: PA2169 family four-helix-bundle protein [Candidatus Korobacteraceae bacterium]
MAFDDFNSTVENLIETCKDGENGFRDAAENVERTDLKTFFREQSAERGRFARQLEEELVRLGEPGKDRIGGAGVRERGSVSGALHRAWMDLKASFGAGDHGILKTVEAAEDTAKDAYEDALKAPLPPTLLEVVRVQAMSVRTTHDRVRALRDRMAA